jgi:hypothetical protein
MLSQAPCRVRRSVDGNHVRGSKAGRRLGDSPRDTQIMAESKVVDLKTLEQFRRRRSSGQGVFVIVGRPSGRVLVHDVACPFMTDDASAPR